jgi:hypothetical protein
MSTAMLLVVRLHTLDLALPSSTCCAIGVSCWGLSSWRKTCISNHWVMHVLNDQCGAVKGFFSYGVNECYHVTLGSCGSHKAWCCQTSKCSTWKKSTYAIKASVAQVNRQILRPDFPCFVLLIPHFTLLFYFACENPSQGYRHRLYEPLCAHLYRWVPTTSAGPQIRSAQQHVSAS